MFNFIMLMIVYIRNASLMTILVCCKSFAMMEQLFDPLEGVLPTPGSRMNLPDKITIVDAGKLRFIEYMAG